MTEFPLFSWYWIGSIGFILLSLIGLSVWFNYFYQPHIHSKKQ